MRKAVTTISALSCTFPQPTSASPFVGEHADKSSIDHGNGTFSLKLKAKQAPYNKYESIWTKRNDLFPERQESSLTGLLSTLSGLVFGEQMIEDS